MLIDWQAILLNKADEMKYTGSFYLKNLTEFPMVDM